MDGHMHQARLYAYGHPFLSIGGISDASCPRKCAGKKTAAEPRESLPCPDVREYVARQYVKHSKFKKAPPSLQDPINPQRTGGAFIGMNAKQHLLIHKAYVKSCI